VGRQKVLGFGGIEGRNGREKMKGREIYT